jgi:hypothetical protein
MLPMIETTFYKSWRDELVTFPTCQGMLPSIHCIPTMHVRPGFIQPPHHALERVPAFSFAFLQNVPQDVPTRRIAITLEELRKVDTRRAAVCQEHLLRHFACAMRRTCDRLQAAQVGDIGVDAIAFASLWIQVRHQLLHPSLFFRVLLPHVVNTWYTYSVMDEHHSCKDE